MSTADVLSSQREEINRCVLRREKLLRTLFGVTYNYLRITEGYNEDATDADKQERELNAFLDANDISQNRFFDSSTLPPSTRIPQYDRRKTLEVTGPKNPHSHRFELATNHDRFLSREDSLGTSREGLLLGKTTGEESSRKGDAHQAALSHPQPECAATTNAEAATAQETKQAVEGVGEEGHTLRKEQGHSNEDPSQSSEQEADLDTLPQPDGHTAETANNLTPPDSGRIVFAKEGPSNQNASKSQAKVLRAEARGVPPATPDEQLRFEDDQALRRSQGPIVSDNKRTASAATSSDLPSQFIQGAYDDSNSIMDISPLGEEAASKQPVNEPTSPVANQQPAHGMRNQIFTGMHVDTSKDPTFSRRPPMRIDTGMPSMAKETSSTSDKVPATASEEATPSKMAPLSSVAQSPPERMRTRVSSGALRHKSVSEILGETPKTAASPSERYSQEAHKHEQSSPQLTTSPDVTAFRLRLSELKDKERSKLSTVVFSKQQSAAGCRPVENSQHQSLDREEKAVEDRDYFLTFFAAQVYQTPRAPPLTSLLRQANKALTTSDHYIDIREKQDYKILNQIKDMQHFNRWSLRQPVRQAEPQRPATHWDVLLGNMKWMRTDFREERKFKLAGAKYLAEACATWVATPPPDRSSLQVKVRHPPKDMSSNSDSSTPDLVNDEHSEATEEELSLVDLTTEKPPATIFSLPPDVFVFGLNKSPMAEKLLLELPCYDPAKDIQDAALGLTELDPDSNWRKPLVPVSKYAYGKLVSSEEGPPSKKARLDYSDNRPESQTTEQEDAEEVLRPVEDNVALFNPENKHIRDRIHAGHAFRPPSEHQMPSRDFFESRSPSQWTLAEDDELRRLVREYSYNWSLISSCFSSTSLYSSGAERRTPWECFERWISLEGLPAEMSKVPYFRTYHQRLQQAARTYEARQHALIQQNGGNPAQVHYRRRTNQPYTVEKRKNLKPLHLVDAMRKHAKKKEAAAHKQQQQATLGAMRKNNHEPPRERPPLRTPRELSRKKYEQQVKMEETSRMLRMQYISAQNAKKAAQHQQANQQPNGVPSNRNLPPALPNGSSPNVPSTAAQLRGPNLDSARTGPQLQRLVNGQVNGGPSNHGHNVPNAPMQSQMQMPMGQRGQPQMASEMRVIQEVQRVQEQQAYLQQRQQQRLPQQNGQASSPNMHNINSLPQNSPSLLGSHPGRSSPSINGGPALPGTSTSPHLNQSQPQSLSSGMTPAVNQIQNQVKLRNPNATTEEISRLTTEQLYRMHQQQSLQQSAMAAAVGNSGGNLGSMPIPSPIMQQQNLAPGGNLNQQQYANFMRTQQASQQRSVSVGSSMAPGVSGSRSTTPMVQRTGSAQGGGPPRGPSQSPRPGPVGIAGGQ